MENRIANIGDVVGQNGGCMTHARRCGRKCLKHKR